MRGFAPCLGHVSPLPASSGAAAGKVVVSQRGMGDAVRAAPASMSNRFKKHVRPWSARRTVTG